MRIALLLCVLALSSGAAAQTSGDGKRLLGSPAPQQAAQQPTAPPMNPFEQAARDLADYKPSYWDVVGNSFAGDVSPIVARQQLIQQKMRDLQRHYAPAMVEYARNYIAQNIPDKDPRKALLMADPINGFKALLAGAQRLSSEPVLLKSDEPAVRANTEK